MSEPTILVTGAAGLLGNAVRVMLEADGRRVLPIDRVPMTEEGRPITVCDLSGVHRLHALAVESRIVGIVHCGAHSGPMVARDNPYSIVQVNIVGTANVIEIAPTVLLLASRAGAFYTGQTLSPNGGDVMV